MNKGFIRAGVFLIGGLVAVIASAATYKEKPDLGKREYPANVQRIVDADTFDLLVDLGFQTYSMQRVRLAGVDAWEMRGEEKVKGKMATEFVKRRMPEDSWVVVSSDGKKGKYGRFIVDVQLSTGEQLGELLLKEGHAEPYE